jgi:RNA polymerase sigma factor (sigma-70 family)
LNEEPIIEADKRRMDALFSRDYEALVNALYNFAHHLSRNADDAADLVQDTFLKAYKNYDKYEQGTNFKAWLFRILKNTFINDYNRRIKHQATVDFDDIRPYHDTDELAPNAPTAYLDLRHELFDEMLGDEITAALEALPPDAHTIIMLDLEDFSYDEMSEILNIPPGTVRSRLFRARNLLKQQLYDYATSQGYKDKR